ncbi:MAG: hypothetical protein O2971_13590 [Proteobacteria bacterium]|nr:hypothetical protein [Pseudomonadota bacterium]
MATNSDSQCYFIQLQIDSFIDDDLSAPQRETFTSHIHQCKACANEFHYAQTVQDAILDLPLIDCEENVLEPIHRLANGPAIAPETTSSSIWSQLGAMLSSTPVFARYALPLAAVAVVAITVFPVLTEQSLNVPMVAEHSAGEQVEEFSPEDIAKALQDLNLAIDYLNQVSQRTEVMIGDRFLITPLQDSLNASFERASSRRQDRLQDDPI